VLEGHTIHNVPNGARPPFCACVLGAADDWSRLASQAPRRSSRGGFKGKMVVRIRHFAVSRFCVAGK
jgi:hypothetical protein